jgi:hypothetical protein
MKEGVTANGRRWIEGGEGLGDRPGSARSVKMASNARILEEMSHAAARVTSTECRSRTSYSGMTLSSGPFPSCHPVRFRAGGT